MGGYLQQRPASHRVVEVPPLRPSSAVKAPASADQHPMELVQIQNHPARQGGGPACVPIVADEARTFGMAGCSASRHLRAAGPEVQAGGCRPRVHAGPAGQVLEKASPKQAPRRGWRWTSYSTNDCRLPAVFITTDVRLSSAWAQMAGRRHAARGSCRRHRSAPPDGGPQTRTARADQAGLIPTCADDRLRLEVGPSSSTACRACSPSSATSMYLTREREYTIPRCRKQREGIIKGSTC